jgi:1-acyl-sn-glycerol-3-phosphate acyltransferase
LLRAGAAARQAGYSHREAPALAKGLGPATEAAMGARSVLFNLLFYLNFLVQALVFSPVLLLPRRFVWPVARFWAASSLRLHRALCGVGEEVRGLERLPGGACLIACKHQSAWETLRLVTLVPGPSFILKRELMWIPLFGWYLAKTGMIPVQRGRRSRALEAIARHAAARLAEGRQVIIFPEGTRRAPGAEPAYKYGVTYLYDRLGVGCVPVALNSGLYWPRRAWSHRRGTVLMEVLEPVAPGLPPAEFAERLEESIESATHELITVALRQQPALADDVAGNRAEPGESAGVRPLEEPGIARVDRNGQGSL